MTIACFTIAGAAVAEVAKNSGKKRLPPRPRTIVARDDSIINPEPR